jgi:hypothetical protein
VLGDWSLIPGEAGFFFATVQLSDRLWDPSSLMSSFFFWGSFLSDKAAGRES